MDMTTLVLEPGITKTRAELAEAFGGSRYSGGIVPAHKSGMIFVFSDPRAGAEHDYTFDGYAGEDDYGPLYLYTGAGQKGPQQLKGNNRSLLEHRERGMAVHLFVADGKVRGSAAVLQRYIGEVVVDPTESVVERWSTSGTPRRLYVFRFRPAPGKSWHLTSADALQPAPSSSFLSVPSSRDEGALASKAIPTEQHRTDQTLTRLESRIGAVIRREGRLVTSFEERLGREGHEFHRHQITVQGTADSLITDLYDVTDKVLYEAKGQSRREHVRMAVGQLLDYRRHIPIEGLRLAVLLPDDPGEDLRDLLDSAGISLVFQRGSDFEGFPLPAVPAQRSRGQVR